LAGVFHTTSVIWSQ